MIDLYSRAVSEKSREASLERELTKTQNELWRTRWASQSSKGS